MSEDKSVFSQFSKGNLGLKSNWFIGIGVVLLAFGLLALFDILITTLVSILFLGILLILSGIVHLVQGFVSKKGSGQQVWSAALLGVLYLLGGFLLIQEPETGSIIITAFLAVCLIGVGCVRAFWAVTHRHIAHWWTFLLGAVVAFATGLYIFLTLPWSGFWLIGTVLALELIFGGLSALAFGLALRRSGD